jgi:hypothetical protein
MDEEVLSLTVSPLHGLGADFSSLVLDSKSEGVDLFFSRRLDDEGWWLWWHLHPHLLRSHLSSQIYERHGWSW